MARAYSDDLRERVAAAVLSGRSGREVAATFGVSVASALKWSQRLRETGSACARPQGCHIQPAGLRRSLASKLDMAILMGQDQCRLVLQAAGIGERTAVDAAAA